MSAESDALWWGSSLGHITPSSPRLILVVDTNVVLSSVDNDCRRSGRRSWLLRITDAGTGRLFAAPHVYHECYRHLPKIARSSSASLEELRGRFDDEYLPRIRFVDPGPRVATDAAAAAVAMLDSDDEPTAVLASLLAPSLVVSDDKHLRVPGLAPADWRRVATAGAEVAAADLSKAGLALAVAGSVSGLAGLVRWMGNHVGASPLVRAALLGGLGIVWLGDSDRRAKAHVRAAPLLRALVDGLAGLEARGEGQPGAGARCRSPARTGPDAGAARRLPAGTGNEAAISCRDPRWPGIDWRRPWPTRHVSGSAGSTRPS